MSVLKSNTTGSNDLGFRGILVVQFVLLIWAAPIVRDAFFRCDAAARPGAPWLRFSLLCTLALGLAGSGVQLVLLRAYAPLADSGKLVRSERFLGLPGFGERTYWLRSGFSRLNELTGPGTTVQYNPVRDEVLISHLYSTRQAVMGDAFCGSAFGGDVAKCREAFPYVASAFNAPDVVRQWNLDRFCDDFQVNLLVASDADPVWHDPSSWVWTRPSLLTNPSMHAIPCGTGVRSLAATR